MIMAAASVAPAEAAETSVEEVLQGDVALGIPLGDIRVIKAVRRVVLLAALGNTYYLCNFIWRLMTGTYISQGERGSNDSLWSGLSQLVIELSIPACGYYGALYGHRTLVFFFCGANLIFVVASVINFFRFVVRVSGAHVQCKEEQYTSARYVCEVWLAGGPERYMLLGSMLVLMWFQCCSFWFGKNLYQNLGPSTSGISPQMHIPIVGEVMDYPAARNAQGSGSGAAASSSTERGEASLANAPGGAASASSTGGSGAADNPTGVILVAPTHSPSHRLRNTGARQMPGSQDEPV